VEYSDFKKMHQSPKRSWFSRHPIASGIVGAALIGGVLWATKCESSPQKEKTASATTETKRGTAAERRQRRVEAQLEKIMGIIELQKKLVENGWYERREEEREEQREEFRVQEEEFLLELEGKTKEQLVELLISQHRIIGQFREYADGADDIELAHEEKKGKLLQQKLDELEIAERGLLQKSIEELEALLIELDNIIMEERYYPIEDYMEVIEERSLIAKAIEEKQFWDSVWSPRS